MKQKKLKTVMVVSVVLVLLVVIGVAVWKYDQLQALNRDNGLGNSFNKEGLTNGIMLEGDDYPYEEETSTKLTCTIKSKSEMHLSDFYLIERDGQAQIRFRMTITMEQASLLRETQWKITDAAGNEYARKLVVQPENFKGYLDEEEWDCLVVTLRLDEEEYKALSGEMLEFLIVCTHSDDLLNVKKSYAHSWVEVKVPCGEG